MINEFRAKIFPSSDCITFAACTRDMQNIKMVLVLSFALYSTCRLFHDKRNGIIECRIQSPMIDISSAGCLKIHFGFLVSVAVKRIACVLLAVSHTSLALRIKINKRK